MADLDFDCASIHFGLIKSEVLLDTLSSLSKTFANTNISNSELTTLHLLKDSQSLIDNKMTSAVKEVYRRLTNSKNILINMDKEAELFFEYVGTGLLDENLKFTDIPYYDQENYYNIPFANSNIGSCGCGYTSMCMALSYLENKILTPDLRAGEVDRSVYNLESKMMKIAELEGVNVYKEEYIDYNKLRERLAEGKMCIVLVKDRSHFVLCKGVTDDGRVLVNDPYGKWASTAPYTEAQLQRGSSGMVWVIDPYQNVGAASNSIGKVSVSQDVLSEIQRANAGKGYVDITSRRYIKALEKSTQARQSGDYKSILGPSAVDLSGTDQSNRPKAETLATEQGDKQTDNPVDTTYYAQQLSHNSGGTTGEGSPVGNSNPSSPAPKAETVESQIVETSSEPTVTTTENISITSTTRTTTSTSGATSITVRNWSTKTPITSSKTTATSTVTTAPPAAGETLTQTINKYTSQSSNPVIHSERYTVSPSTPSSHIDVTPRNNLEVNNMVPAEEAVVHNTGISVEQPITSGPKVSEPINVKVDSESLIAKSPTPEYDYNLVKNNQISSNSNGTDYSKYLGLAAGILGTLAVGTAAVALMKKTEEE
ncbi:MAG: C39 family peptidase [Bacilli bacterium]|nr:C39 family peptidase [Bacilli bacterium]